MKSFREKRAKEHAILEIINQFQTNDRKLYTWKIFIDLQKTLTQWFASYLPGRKQIAIFNGRSSQALFSCRTNDAYARGVDLWQRKVQIHCVLEF